MEEAPAEKEHATGARKLCGPVRIDVALKVAVGVRLHDECAVSCVAHVDEHSDGVGARLDMRSPTCCWRCYGGRDAVMSMVGVGLGDAVVEAVLPGWEAINTGGYAMKAHA